MLLKVLFAFSVISASCTNVCGYNDNDQGVLRKVVCNDGMDILKNIKCDQDADNDPTVMGLHNVMFGYLNGSTNCSETQETNGCEERMPDFQMDLMMENLTAQVAMNALQFPADDMSNNCKAHGDKPDYMALNFDCLKTSSISEMCNASTKTGQKLSVYNNGYPDISSVDGTHHCECKIISPAPVISITIYDYRLNCTGDQQNLTIEEEHGSVLVSVCDSFRSGQYNSSNQNLTMVWKGQIKSIGLFWVGFQAVDDLSNVTVNCYPIWDPTSTTITTPATTDEVTTIVASSSHSSTSSTLTPSSSIATNTSKSSNGVSSSTVSLFRSMQSLPAKSTQMINIGEHEPGALSNTLVYSCVSGGGGVLLICATIAIVRKKITGNCPSYKNMTRENNSILMGQIPFNVSSTSQGNAGQIPSKVSSTFHGNEGQKPSKVSSTSQGNAGQIPSKVSSTFQGNAGKIPSKVSSTSQGNAGQIPSKVSSTSQGNAGQIPSKVSSTSQGNAKDNPQISTYIELSKGSDQEKKVSDMSDIELTKGSDQEREVSDIELTKGSDQE